MQPNGLFERPMRTADCGQIAKGTYNTTESLLYWARDTIAALIAPEGIPSKSGRGSSISRQKRLQKAPGGFLFDGIRPRGPGFGPEVPSNEPNRQKCA
ncbi:unnamed protein product, partial [Iphiclides podalirius]